ncbi:hypothetical protein B0T09DRAFT_344247 [Sordaria sp. MPI-SDFR-AT-0083]|nr:hypothetical protein B0T09DRAFT_344247 [Sordaria sp. MPI-SDFR-AT-0083]
MIVVIICCPPAVISATQQHDTATWTDHHHQLHLSLPSALGRADRMHNSGNLVSLPSDPSLYLVKKINHRQPQAAKPPKDPDAADQPTAHYGMPCNSSRSCFLQWRSVDWPYTLKFASNLIAFGMHAVGHEPLHSRTVHDLSASLVSALISFSRQPATDRQGCP